MFFLQRIDGGRMETWLEYKDLAHELVNKFELKALTKKELEIFARKEGVMIAEERQFSSKDMDVSARSRAIPIFGKTPGQEGGMKIPHMHLEDDVFLLNQDALHEFTKQIVRNVQTRLEHAGQINFTQIMEISEAVVGIRGQ